MYCTFTALKVQFSLAGLFALKIIVSQKFIIFSFKGAIQVKQNNINFSPWLKVNFLKVFLVHCVLMQMHKSKGVTVFTDATMPFQIL